MNISRRYLTIDIIRIHRSAFALCTYVVEKIGVEKSPDGVGALSYVLSGVTW